MLHDFRIDPTGPEADKFCEWLLSETTSALARDHGNGEATKTSIFLFVNRAFEAHLPESNLIEIFVKAVVRAGYREEEEEPVFAWLEAFAEVARAVHDTTNQRFQLTGDARDGEWP